MASQQTQDPDKNSIEPVKNEGDSPTTTTSGMGKLWKSIREIKPSTFITGALLTGAIVIGVVALFGGYMGSTGALEVNRIAVPTLEKGMGAGISAALNFLGSGMGLLTMAAGATAITAGKMIINQHTQAAVESERLAVEYEHSQNLAKDHEKLHEKNHDHAKKAAQTEENIYKQGSVVKGENFTAAELKRRTERENQTENRTF